MATLTKKSLATLLVSLFCSAQLYAAQELTPARADALESFKEISVRGLFYSESDSVDAISKAADKEGAAAFYITSTTIHPSNDALRIVYAKLYRADAVEKEVKEPVYREFRGVYEYPKSKAIRLEPYDIMRLRGYFPTQIELNDAVGKAALGKEAYAFYIDRMVESGSNNYSITAYLFKKDAAERKLQPENAIPYDSEAGQQALAQGGEAAMQVERPGYYSPSAFNEQFYIDKFGNKEVVDATTSSRHAGQSAAAATTATAATASAAVGSEAASTPEPAKSILPVQRSTRYTVTLPDGTRIEELNDATALKMVPFDSARFRGYYVTDEEISYQAAKRAAEKGAKYYHITRVAEDTSGPNRTISIDLFK